MLTNINTSNTMKDWKIHITDNKDVFNIIERRPNEREDICTIKGKDNAKIIATAPELLHAAQEYCRIIMDNGCIPDIEQIKLTELFNNAIKKAIL